MVFETSEVDGKIGVIIIRLACGLLGIAGIVMLADGFISWLRDSSEYASIWNAMVGDEPYCRVGYLGGIRFGGGYLWKVTPNGMLPALCEICLYFAMVAAAIFNRLSMYFIVALLMILDSI